jgi:hypothetical protein
MEPTTSWRLRSLKGTHYTGALVTNAIAISDIGSLPAAGVVISRITLWSDQNLAWDVSLFRSATAQPSADLDLDKMVDWFRFQVGDGVQIAGAGPYRYSVTGLNLRYFPEEGRAIVGLINRDATAKIAGAAGEVVIELEGPAV